METCGCAPNSVTYVAALKACTSLTGKKNGGGVFERLKRGRKIHSEIGCDSNIFVLNTLINMYAKCGSMVEARLVFDSIQNPGLVSWNALLSGYAENGEGVLTLKLFSKMKSCKCAPDSITYLAALKACPSLAGHDRDECLKWGRGIHLEMRNNLNIFLQSSLIDMYGKCGSMKEARAVFENIQKPNLVCWNALLWGYAENGDGLSSLQLFWRLKSCGCTPDSVTYIAAFKACTSLAGKRDGNGQHECLMRGRKVHSEIRCDLSMFLQNTLIDMYAKCRSIEEARRVFDSIKNPDVVSWTNLLMGYAENGRELATLEMFSRMKTCGCTPDSVAYIAVIKACTSLAEKEDGRGQGEWLKRGRKIHSEIGGSFDILVSNTLIDMYAKCRSMGEARRIFDIIGNPGVVSWNALLMGYADNGNGLATLELFSRMNTCGCIPSCVTYLAVLKACTSLVGKRDGGGQEECLKRGREIHSEIGCNLDILVQNTLMDMYAKCGSMVDARCVFDSIRKPNVVSWNVLLFGYVENGEGHTALKLFSKMKARSECAPDSGTYVAALKACGLLGALALGRKLHLEVSEYTAHLVTCLVDFYAKCGSMVEACEVFDLHATARVVPTWNALIAGYGNFGDAVSAFNIFEAMRDQGFQPDAITFVCIFTCCSHSGLVEKAKEYFDAMDMQFGVTPTMTHYTCMVDILGRANRLNEAITFLQKMPYSPDAVAWMTLLAACYNWKNFEIGRFAFQSLLEMDKKMPLPGWLLETANAQ